MKFECNRCGACCRPGWSYTDGTVGLGIIVNNAEIENIARYLEITPEEACAKYNIEQNMIHTSRTACTFFDENLGCTIHPVKPVQCSRWPHIQFFEAPSIPPSKRDARLRVAAAHCPGLKP